VVYLINIRLKILNNYIIPELRRSMKKKNLKKVNTI